MPVWHILWLLWHFWLWIGSNLWLDLLLSLCRTALRGISHSLQENPPLNRGLKSPPRAIFLFFQLVSSRVFPKLHPRHKWTKELTLRRKIPPLGQKCVTLMTFGLHFGQKSASIEPIFTRIKNIHFWEKISKSEKCRKNEVKEKSLNRVWPLGCYRDLWRHLRKFSAYAEPSVLWTLDTPPCDDSRTPKNKPTNCKQ